MIRDPTFALLQRGTWWQKLRGQHETQVVPHTPRWNSDEKLIVADPMLKALQRCNWRPTTLVTDYALFPAAWRNLRGTDAAPSRLEYAPFAAAVAATTPWQAATTRGALDNRLSIAATPGARALVCAVLYTPTASGKFVATANHVLGTVVTDNGEPRAPLTVVNNRPQPVLPFPMLEKAYEALLTRHEASSDGEAAQLRFDPVSANRGASDSNQQAIAYALSCVTGQPTYAACLNLQQPGQDTEATRHVVALGAELVKPGTAAILTFDAPPHLPVFADVELQTHTHAGRTLIAGMPYALEQANNNGLVLIDPLRLAADPRWFGIPTYAEESKLVYGSDAGIALGQKVSDFLTSTQGPARFFVPWTLLLQTSHTCFSSEKPQRDDEATAVMRATVEGTLHALQHRHLQVVDNERPRTGPFLDDTRQGALATLLEGSTWSYGHDTAKLQRGDTTLVTVQRTNAHFRGADDADTTLSFLQFLLKILKTVE